MNLQPGLWNKAPASVRATMTGAGPAAGRLCRHLKPDSPAAAALASQPAATTMMASAVAITPLWFIDEFP
jgi:hypothetical protein